MVVFGSKQILDKTFSCMGCRQTIRLQRKDDDSGWNKYNLDGSPHTHEQQKRKAKSSVTQEQEQPQQRREEEQPPQQPAFDTKTQRAILELLQTVDKKLDALLATNSGVKTSV